MLFDNHYETEMALRSTPRRTSRTGRVSASASSKLDKMPLITNFISNWAKRHANATPDAPTKRQILKRRIAAFQKPFGPEFIRIWVDILAVMSQVDTADHYGTRLK